MESNPLSEPHAGWLALRLTNPSGHAVSFQRQRYMRHNPTSLL